MKKHFNKRKILSIFIIVPLLVIGIAFSFLNLNNEYNLNSTQNIDTMSANTKALEDSSYVDVDDVEFKINQPNPIDFDEDKLATFSFTVEKATGNTWADFVDSLEVFDIIFEASGTTYGEKQLAKISLTYSNFDNYFKTTASDSSAVATYTTKNPVNIADVTGYGFDENAEYQARILWEGGDVDRVQQYTLPITFIYGVSAPVVSYRTYYGYQQALVEADILLYNALLDAFTASPYMTSIYSRFFVTWDDQVNRDFVTVTNENAELQLIATDKAIIDTGSSSNMIKIYLMFDNLKDGEEISVNIDYNLTPEFANLKGSSSYSTTFHSQQYAVPELQPVLSEDVIINDFDTLDEIAEIPLYGGVTVPFTFKWMDNNFPAQWTSIDTVYGGAHFTPEITFNRIISSVRIESITSTGLGGGPVDTATVKIDDNSTEKNWNTKDPENVTKETLVYFSNLELGKNYEVSLRIEFKNPDMFDGSTEFVTETVNFSVPDKIDEPKISITNIETPKDETGAVIDDPKNWNQLNVTFNIERPDQWQTIGMPGYSSIPISDIFSNFEIIAMTSTTDEDGNTIYDESTAVVTTAKPSDLKWGENTVTISGLNSDYEYGIKVSGLINWTYARLFGYKELSGNTVDSPIISSNTRKKESLPVITANTDLHDEYDPTENSTKYTYGFYIDNPMDDSWAFITDDSNPSSAFYYKNIIRNAYVTNVYSETDITSSEAQSLYSKKFYVNNDKPGTASNGTDLDGLYVANETNDISNANSITIDGLKSTWAYSGKLVIELTDEAVDAAQGWIDSETNTINTTFHFTPGHPVKAPVVEIESITTEQTTYDRHSAKVNGTIDVNKLLIPNDPDTGLPLFPDERTYFEESVLVDAQINSNIWLESEGEVFTQLSPKSWLSILPTWKNEDELVEGDVNYFSATENKYHFQIQFDNLKANTDYEIYITTEEDFGYIEDILDTGDYFKTGLNESLTSDDVNVYFTNFEFGNQNEATNFYDTVQVNVSQNFDISTPDAYTDYYDDLSKNVTSMEVQDVDGNAVAIFDPATISDLTVNVDEEGNATGFGDISATLTKPIPAEATINLADYKLVVETDEAYTMPGFTVNLDSISPVSTFTTGGLEVPEIKSLEAHVFKKSIKFDWDVTNKNNIKDAKLEIKHKTGLTDEVINSGDTLYDFTTFDIEDAGNWTDSQETFNPIPGDEYWAELTINPLSTCVDDPTKVLTMESEHVTAAESINFTFDIESVTTSYDTIVIDYSWADNTGKVISDLKFEVIDKYAVVGEGEELPVIYSEEFNIEPTSMGGAVSGSNSLTISNEDLVEGYELYSNQQYELNISYRYKKQDVLDIQEYRQISEVLEDPADDDLLQPSTLEKNDTFVDSVLTSNEASSQLGVETTENSFAFKYNWDNRVSGDRINKGVTYNTIRIYEDGIISDEKLIWESENYVDTKPGTKGGTEVYEVHNGDDNIGGKALVEGRDSIEITPNSKFIIVPYVEYDVYGQNSREFETENRSTQKTIKIPFAMTEVSFNEAETKFIDNDSVELSYHFEKATAFSLSDESYMEIFVVDENGQPHDLIYNGALHDGTDGVIITSDEISSFWTHNLEGENDFADFVIRLDGLTTKFESSITVSTLLHVQNSDGSSNERETSIELTNNTNQKESAFVDASNMGVISRKDVLGLYWDYEIKVESNYPINFFKDVVVSEVGLPNSESKEIQVLDQAQVEVEFTYNENNLYLRVDKTIVAENAAYNDLSFLLGRYIGVNAENLTTGMSSTRVDASWEGYDWFAIDDFFWLYPPKTIGEIFLEIFIWLLIILAILIAIGTIGGTGYYIFRITFSNKKWYPIVETIANEKFAVFTDYVENFGWTQKFQEYSDLKDKNIKELRQYALEMNIPITFDMNRKDLLKTVSLLTDDEIQKFETFTDDDIDVKNYEILDHWKVARYKKYNFWIKYKLSKLEEKGILTDNDDRLQTIQAQLEYIEKEKQAHEAREQMYDEIKSLVAEVLDTNVELTSEFSADPLSDFKKELEEKANEEKARKEAEEAEIRAAIDAEEKARREAEEAEAKALAEKNEREVKAIKTKLAFDYKKIVVNIASFNKNSNKEVVGAEAAREVSEKLTLERNKINKLMEIFKQREDRIVSLGGEPDVYAFETLNKVDIQIQLSKFEKFENELESMTKQALIEKAKKLKLDVKVSWSKEKLVQDILEQVKERGDFND